MGGIDTILRYQWRAYWRRSIRAQSSTAANQGILLIALALILIKYFRLLGIATTEIGVGKSTMLERLLIGIFVALLFPLFSNARLSISTSALRHLPLTVRKLFVIKAVSLLMPPYAWVIVAGSMAICYPLMRAPKPLAGVFAALLFIVMSWLIGITIAQLLSIAFWRKLLAAIALPFLFAIALYVIGSKDPLGLLRLSSFLPNRFVAQAALADHSWLAIGALSVLTAVTLLAALWSFRQSLEPATNRRSQKHLRLLSFKFPGKMGGFSAKDFRYSRRLLDPYLGFLAGALCSFYLVAADVPSSRAFLIFIIFIFLPNASVAFNCFGLDTRSGLDRYALLPVTGRRIMLSKNVAFAALMGVQLFSIFLLAFWRLGLGVAALGLVESAALALAYMTWGNWMALAHPFKMHFFRLSSGGPPVDALAGVMFGSVPGVLAIRWLFQENLAGGLWIIILMLTVYVALYLCSVVWAGRNFDRLRKAIGEW